MEIDKYFLSSLIVGTDHKYSQGEVAKCVCLMEPTTRRLYRIDLEIKMILNVENVNINMQTRIIIADICIVAFYVRSWKYLNRTWRPGLVSILGNGFSITIPSNLEPSLYLIIGNHSFYIFFSNGKSLNLELSWYLNTINGGFCINLWRFLAINSILSPTDTWLRATKMESFISYVFLQWQVTQSWAQLVLQYRQRRWNVFNFMKILKILSPTDDTWLRAT